MTTYDYVPLDAAIADIYTSLNPDMVNDADIEEWASFAFGSLQTAETYQVALAVKAVENHRFCLPKGLKYIWQIFYKEETNAQDPIDLKIYVSENGSTSSTAWSFINGEYLNNNGWSPLRASETPWALMAHCENSPSFYAKCEHQYFVNKNGVVTTTFERGTIIMAFLGYPQNEAGQFLIPNEEKVINAIRKYVLMRYWERRMNYTGEQMDMKIYTNYKQEWELMRAAAIGDLRLPDIDGLENWKQQTFRLGQHTNSYYSGFGNLAVGENIRFT